MTAVRAERLRTQNRGLPKATSPENPWPTAEDRGFEPRRAVKPNRISSAAP